MKKSVPVSIVLILASLACIFPSITTPTFLPSIPMAEDSPTVSAATPIPSPPVVEVSSPVPSAMPFFLPSPAYTIGPYTPPADWRSVKLGIAMIFLPPDMTILTSGEDDFLADLPLAPGTDQVGRTLYLYDQRDDLNCGNQMVPDQALVVADSSGFQYVFYREYSQEVREGQTIEILEYWKYEYSTCIDLSLTLLSASTSNDGAPVSAFNLLDEIDFLETILSTYYELG
jgi:hypothetical protein